MRQSTAKPINNQAEGERRERSKHVIDMRWAYLEKNVTQDSLVWFGTYHIKCKTRKVSLDTQGTL